MCLSLYFLVSCVLKEILPNCIFLIICGVYQQRDQTWTNTNLKSVCLEAIPVNCTVPSGVWTLPGKRKTWIGEASTGVQYSYWLLQYKPPEEEKVDLSCYIATYLTREKAKTFAKLDDTHAYLFYWQPDFSPLFLLIVADIGTLLIPCPPSVLWHSYKGR